MALERPLTIGAEELLRGVEFTYCGDIYVLYKGLMRKKWKQRYVIISQGCLYIYASRKAKNADQSYSFKHFESATESDPENGEKICFRLSYTTDRLSYTTEQAPILFSCDTFENRTKWIQEFRAAISEVNGHYYSADSGFGSAEATAYSSVQRPAGDCSYLRYDEVNESWFGIAKDVNKVTIDTRLPVQPCDDDKEYEDQFGIQASNVPLYMNKVNDADNKRYNHRTTVPTDAQSSEDISKTVMTSDKEDMPVAKDEITVTTENEQHGWTDGEEIYDDFENLQSTSAVSLIEPMTEDEELSEAQWNEAGFNGVLDSTADLPAPPPGDQPKGDDDEEFDQFLCSGKVKSIKKLIESGKLPRQRILDEMCQIFGRKSKTIKVTCKAICEHIKSKHVAITYVWAAYTIQNPQRITFVITVKHKSEENRSKEPVRLEKLIQYSFVKQYVGEFSLEGPEVIKQHTLASGGLDEKSCQNLESCISKHSEDLMKKHKYLSIISAGSNRSTGFGASWNLLPEKCMVLYVQKKNYIPIDEEPFEKYYDGIAVDVREGAFLPFGRTAREKLDPVKMGCQIRGDLINGQYVEGTLGCFVDHPQFGVCGLTCAHVLLSPWELVRLKTTYSGTLKWPLHDMCKNIYQPANQNSSIGHTVQFIYDEGSSTKSGMDLALFKITDRHPKSATFPDATIISASMINNIKYDSWRICSTDRLNQKEDLVMKFGSTTELRRGTIMFDNIAVKHLDSYPLASGHAVIKLFKQIEVKTHTYDLAFADSGDSGALVFLAENNSQYSCIGIVEGGTTYGTVVVTPIVPILKELKVHCLKSFESETNLSDIDNQIQSMHWDIQNIKCDLQSVRQDTKNIDNTLQMIAQSLRNNQQ